MLFVISYKYSLKIYIILISLCSTGTNWLMLVLESTTVMKYILIFALTIFFYMHTSII